MIIPESALAALVRLHVAERRAADIVRAYRIAGMLCEAKEQDRLEPARNFAAKEALEAMSAVREECRKLWEGDTP